MCSGTESPVLATAGFTEAVNGVDGVSDASDSDRSPHRIFDHIFSCEIDPTKRSFIKTAHRHNIKMVFSDAVSSDAKSLKSGRKVKDLISGVFIDLDTVDIDILFAGFPCQAASTVNNFSHSDNNRNCIESGSLGTGEVFEAIMGFLEALAGRVKIVFLEHVYSHSYT